MRQNVKESPIAGVESPDMSFTSFIMWAPFRSAVNKCYEVVNFLMKSQMVDKYFFGQLHMSRISVQIYNLQSRHSIFVTEKSVLMVIFGISLLLTR